MKVLYLGLGIVLLVGGIVDILWTTLWVDGSAGPLSSRMTTGVWRGIRRVSSRQSRLLSLSGPLLLVLSLLLWVGLVWLGWTLVFAAETDAIVNTRTNAPVGWAQRFYYVGYTMFTMGNGDFYPPTAGWQIATAVTTASGMLFVTLSVSYVLSVLEAVSVKRSFASGVTGLGGWSEVLVRSSWDADAESFRGLETALDRLTSQLDTLGEQHDSYPILHYYHSERGQQSSAVAVAILDEALTIFHEGIPDDQGPNEAILKSARASTTTYLQTLDSAFIEAADEPPPPPDLDRIRDADIPTVSDDEFAEAIEELDERRRKVRGLVENDAWEWRTLEE
ncbi:potassium channel family protein [Haloarculaceae archaeon H-GB2-1]|nr:potassium channel family protein [Haloarculaceae archaeon H-GB1-1]MEA5386031.1 potassium channel family protein [Haloarculaceae archaeon H-GB11]MEA5407536.1 potassium channel family protein [Haloarculaceae archaeon H-GB2-1]